MTLEKGQPVRYVTDENEDVFWIPSEENVLKKMVNSITGFAGEFSPPPTMHVKIIPAL